MAGVDEFPNMSPPEENPAEITAVLKMNLGCQLDLEFIARSCNNAKYNKILHAVILELEQSGTTGWIFRTGMLWCKGAQSKKQAIEGAMECMRILSHLGFPVKFLNPETRFCCQLEVLFRNPGPNLHLRYGLEDDNKASRTIFGTDLSIFASGLIVITGAKRADVRATFNMMLPILEEFVGAV